MKICTYCNESKSEFDFGKHAGRRDGLQNICKSCKSRVDKIYRNNNKEKLAEYHHTYWIENRESLQEYYKNYYTENKERISKRNTQYKLKNRGFYLEYHRKYYRDNREYFLELCKIYRYNNKDIIRIRQQKYYKKNKEKIVKYIKEWAKSPEQRHKLRIRCHTRRNKIKSTGNTLTFEQWNKILETQNNRCAICGRKFNSKLKANRDHIIPLSKGGGLTFENVQALCISCNSKKNNRIDYSNIVSWGIFNS